MKFSDSAQAKGFLEVWAMSASLTLDGLTIDHILNTAKYGTCLTDGPNTVVDVGRESTAKIESGEWPADPIVTFCVGTGGYTTPPMCAAPPNPPLGTDIDLYALVDSRPIQSVEHPNIAADTFVAFIDASELNGYSFSEWALKRASGKLYSRRTTKPYPKDGAFAILAKWTIQY